MKLLSYITGLLLLSRFLLIGEGTPARWQRAAGPLETRWSAQVNPTNSHPEYPRPQLVRSQWLNLNGLWDFAITPAAAPEATNYQGAILVPFPIESALSGVMRPLQENEALWYRRNFTVPPEWREQRVRLHFGAVDWQARVIVNGREVGKHRGGYDGFSFDITRHLKWTGNEEIVVAVLDPTEADQPRGKQSRKPEGIFYTPSSGIWQTVWLEPIPETCINDLQLTPDVDVCALRLNVAANTLSDAVKVEAVALADGKEVGRVSGPANKDLVLPISCPHLWSPDDPFLYDLQISLKNGERVVDSVSSYFGMRKVALRRDTRGVMRMALNDKFTFQMGSLDQGFWPDGLYTAPTDEALRFDIEFIKHAGFNLARKHVKVEPDRWYYWCDKLGILVWQDMPSGNNTTSESRTQFEVELQRMVKGRRNHPSIIVWTLFNEGWGQYDNERLTAWLKSLDSSRLVCNASGWTDKQVGDIIDRHSYPGPEAPVRDPDRAAVLGEFGGLGLGMPGHTWSTKYWCYLPMPDAKTLTQRGVNLLERVRILRDSFGLSAAVYTQTTDVETECNGLMTYDRAVAKLDPLMARAANVSGREKQFRVIVPNALHDRVVWKYTTGKPPDEWAKVGYNDSGWLTGTGGFGRKETPGTVVNTAWETEDIWLRREFVLDKEDLSYARIQLYYDEDAEVYLNGVLAAQAPGYITSYEEVPITPEAAATLKPGTNLLSVHCHQTRGGQYIDAGIVAPQFSQLDEPKIEAGISNSPNQQSVKQP